MQLLWNLKKWFKMKNQLVAEIDGGAAVEQPEVEQQPVGEGHNGDGDGGINLIREFDPNLVLIQKTLFLSSMLRRLLD